MALEVHSPLRVMVPRIDRSVWLVASTASGGLAAGDRVAVDLTVEADTRALLTCATARRVEAGDRAASSLVRAAVAPGAVLALLSDPVSCAAGAHYEQRVEIDLAGGGSVAVLDRFEAGAARWQMSSLRSDLAVGGLRDTTMLDAAQGSIARRMGRFDVFVRLTLVGPAFAAARDRIVAGLAATGHGCAETVDLSDDALVLHLSAETADAATARVRAHLAEVHELVGDPAA